MIIAKRLNIYRNILPYRFVHKENVERLKELEGSLISYLTTQNFIPLVKTIDKKDYRAAKHKSKEIEIVINHINHITIVGMDFSQDNYHQLYNTLIEVERDIGERFDIAFSERFGYLTPDPTYLPHATEIELITSLFYLAKDGEKDRIIENITLAGYEVKNEFISFDYILTIKLIPSYTEQIMDFIVKSFSFAKTIEKEEEERFNHYKSKNDTIFKDMIEKIKGYALSSSVLNYSESINILLNLYYASRCGYISLNPLLISKAFFMIKNSDVIKDMRENSKVIKSIIKNED